MWGGPPGDEQKRRVSSTHRQEPTESSCSTEYDPGLCLSQNTGLTSGILRRKVAMVCSNNPSDPGKIADIRSRFEEYGHIERERCSIPFRSVDGQREPAQIRFRLITASPLIDGR